MKKLREQVQTLQDIEVLLAKMEMEIDTLRNIVYRYHLQHGSTIKNGTVKIPDNISFHLLIENNDVFCKPSDSKTIGMTNRYEDIKKRLKLLQ